MCNVCCSSLAAADVQLRTEALELLHHFLSLSAGQLQKLTQQVEELANNIFPASSWEWKRGSSQSVDYARQLMALMDSTVAAAEGGLAVEPILQVSASLVVMQSHDTAVVSNLHLVLNNVGWLQTQYCSWSISSCCCCCCC